MLEASRGSRCKVILKEWERRLGRPVVELDGELYQLVKRDSLTQEAIQDARKFGGFFAEYRLLKLGKAL